MRMTTRAPIPAPPKADLQSLARRFRLPLADLSRASAQAVSLVPERWARRFQVVPLSASEHELVIATADPLDVDCERTLAFATGRHVRLELADGEAIAERIEDVYGSGGEGTTREPESVVEVQHLDNHAESAPRISCRSISCASTSRAVSRAVVAGRSTSTSAASSGGSSERLRQIAPHQNV